MEKFTKLISTCLPIGVENIDTDQIIPAMFLKTTKRAGLGKYLFYNWRFDEKGKPRKNNQFNGLNHQTIKILVAGNNFGCGSSREHAVWAILDFGFQVVISSSFGDIFYNNALKNGLLPVIAKPSELNKLFQIIGKHPQTKITIDLEMQKVIVTPGRWPYGLLPGGQKLKFNFPIDNFRKICLLKGVDELGYILSFEKKIKEYEKSHVIFLNN